MPRGRQERGLRRVRTSDGRHFPDAKRASAGRSGGPEDRGLPLQFNCSQEVTVIADHFARTASVVRDSTVLSVINAVCDSGPVFGEFWSSGLMSKLCSWTLTLECVCVVLGLGSVSTCALLFA